MARIEKVAPEHVQLYQMKINGSYLIPGEIERRKQEMREFRGLVQLPKFIIDKTDNPLISELTFLGLSPRILHALYWRKINTVQSLNNTTETELWEIRNLGTKSIERIKKSLQVFRKNLLIMHCLDPNEDVTSEQLDEMEPVVIKPTML